MQALVTAGAGFLLAVLWFDLMFDVQVRGHAGEEELPEPVVGSVASYYRRVTTDARPMSLLVAVAMAATVGAIIAEALRDDVSRGVSAVSLAAALAPMVLARARTVPNPVRLGGRSDPLAEQSRLARSIYADHRVCIASITVLVVVQLAYG